MAVRAERPRKPTTSCYAFKPHPYSSHTLLLRNFPEQGYGSRVLDVGCGNGYLAEILAARGYKVVGIEKCGRVGDHFPETVELIQADLDFDMPRVSGSFAFVLCADVLEHLRDPLKLLVALRTLLEPDGRLVASLPNSGNAYFRLNVLLGRFPAHNRGLFDRTHLHFYTWDGWLDLLATGGFRVEKFELTGVPVGLALPRWEGTFVARILERVSHDLARFWKQLFAYQFVVVARPEVNA